jgi:hypothetical protein
MPDENTLTLRALPQTEIGGQPMPALIIESLAGWLREVMGRCRLPHPQEKLLRVVQRHEYRAGYLCHRTRLK